eukprot:195506-Prymnesium_polylepis.2
MGACAHARPRCCTHASALTLLRSRERMHATRHPHHAPSPCAAHRRLSRVCRAPRAACAAVASTLLARRSPHA